MTKPIELHHSFVKSFKTRIAKNSKLRTHYETRVAMFVDGHRATPINDHALTGGLAGRRAFSITADVRVIYIETADKIIFLDIGTHNQVY